MIRMLLPVLATGLLSACAATPEQQAAAERRDVQAREKLDAALDGFTAGTPTACMPFNNTRRTRYFGDTILYQVSGRLIYRTDTNGGCSLDRDDILVTQSPMGRLCSGDIARTVDRTSRFMTGACAIGEFVPYRKTKT